MTRSQRSGLRGTWRGGSLRLVAKPKNNWRAVQALLHPVCSIMSAEGGSSPLLSLEGILMILGGLALLTAIGVSGGKWLLRRRARRKTDGLEQADNYTADVRHVFPHLDEDLENRSAPEIKAAAAAGRAAAAAARRTSAGGEDVLPPTAHIIREHNVHENDDDDVDPVGWADLPATAALPASKAGGVTWAQQVDEEAETGAEDDEAMAEALANIRQEAARTLNASQGAALEAALEAARVAETPSGSSAPTARTNVSDTQRDAPSENGSSREVREVLSLRADGAPPAARAPISRSLLSPTSSTSPARTVSQHDATSTVSTERTWRLWPETPPFSPEPSARPPGFGRYAVDESEPTHPQAEPAPSAFDAASARMLGPDGSVRRWLADERGDTEVVRLRDFDA